PRGRTPTPAPSGSDTTQDVRGSMSNDSTSARHASQSAHVGIAAEDRCDIETWSSGRIRTVRYIARRGRLRSFALGRIFLTSGVDLSNASQIRRTGRFSSKPPILLPLNGTHMLPGR